MPKDRKMAVVCSEHVFCNNAFTHTLGLMDRATIELLLTLVILTHSKTLLFVLQTAKDARKIKRKLPSGIALL